MKKGEPQVHPAQLQIREVMAAVRRRWKLILIPTVLVTALSAIAVHMQPRRYESATTILVRPDKTLNPIPGYQVGLAYDEQLRNFNEILWSRTVLRALADSLGLTIHASTETERIAIGQSLSGNFTTTLGYGFFRITYYDTDPGRAQRAAQILGNLFIQTKLNVDDRQNALIVQFYEKKVQEYRDALEVSVQSLTSEIKENINQLPMEQRSLYSQLDEIQRDIAAINERMGTHRQALSSLKRLQEEMTSEPDSLRTERGRQYLQDLQGKALPLASDLETLLAQYDEISRRYTAKHPDVEKLESRIAGHLQRMEQAVESAISRMPSEQRVLERKRDQTIELLRQSSTMTRMNKDKEESYQINRRMYDEMALKLDQARLTQEVGSQGANQYIMIDPAFYPTQPAKPKLFLLAAGLGLGFLLGVLSAVLAELFDTTVRTPKDIEIYEKPVIALLPDARED
jgi:succinoglycan biosynthesis transport protein ExoP